MNMKLCMVLMLFSVIANAQVTLDVFTTIDGQDEKKSLVFSHDEEQVIKLSEHYHVQFSTKDQGETVMVNMKVIRTDVLGESVVCSPKLVLGWKQPVTIECPHVDDKNQSRTMTLVAHH